MGSMQYADHGVVVETHAIMNRAYEVMLKSVMKQMQLPVCGTTASTNMQVPLEKMPALNYRFPNMAVEMAYFQQQKLEQRGFPLPPDYFKEHIHPLDVMYLLETAANSIMKSNGQSSIRTSSQSVIESFECIEGYSKKRISDYLNIDPRVDLERGILKTIELRPTDKHTLSLHRMLTQVKSSVITPYFLFLYFARCIIRILENNRVVIRCRIDGQIVNMTTSLRTDFLTYYFGDQAAIISKRCANSFNGSEITLFVVTESQKSRFVQLQLSGLCSIHKA